MEAQVGLEPTVKILQTFVLPLHYCAMKGLGPQGSNGESCCRNRPFSSLYGATSKKTNKSSLNISSIIEKVAVNGPIQLRI